MVDISGCPFKGQVGSNLQRHPICMNGISIVPSCRLHFTNVYLYYIPTIIFEIIAFKRIRSVNYPEKMISVHDQI